MPNPTRCAPTGGYRGRRTRRREDAVEPTLKTVIGGEPVELPGSIAGIRAHLDDDQAGDFDHEVEHAAADQLPVVLARWALASTTAPAADDEVFAALERGQDIGATTPGHGHGEVA